MLTVASVLALSAPALAQDPVRFDARRVFACTEMKPSPGADVSRKVIVVSIPISANFAAPEASVERLRYELRMPKLVTVIDYLPKTRTEAEVRELSERRIDDRQTEVRVEFGGQAKTEFNALGAHFSLGGGGERQSREFTQAKTDTMTVKLPPQKQRILAGFDDEGQTRYWELPWHTQGTRAGQSEYVILAEVAKDWTGDIGTLVCTAYQGDRVVASMKKVIGLYLNGDGAARKRVEERALTASPAPDSADADLLTTSIGLTLKRIPKGSFPMGADPDDTEASPDERPQHRVTISRPFYIGVYEVTQHEYKQVMGQNPSKFQDSDQ
jgi:formylglycine-generating enzyme required for sulfatase activity